MKFCKMLGKIHTRICKSIECYGDIHKERPNLRRERAGVRKTQTAGDRGWGQANVDVHIEKQK